MREEQVDSGPPVWYVMKKGKLWVQCWRRRDEGLQLEASLGNVRDPLSVSKFNSETGFKTPSLDSNTTTRQPGQAVPSEGQRPGSQASLSFCLWVVFFHTGRAGEGRAG